MAKPAPDLWRIEIVVPEAAVDMFEAALEAHVDTVSWFLVDESRDPGEGTDWRLEGVSRTPPDRVAVEAALAAAAAASGVEPPELRLSRLADRDWVSENLRSFPPIAAGRFYVHGSHIAEPPPAGKVSLLVDAGTAFGSGEHASTYGCLLALDLLARRRRFHRPLDLGCGSGILAMAMASLWPVPVLATDIDPRSVAVARENARRNGLAARVDVQVSDGYRSPEITRRAPFDLIVANILARPLVRMSPQLAARLAPGGMAVLSGLLARQERQVLNAHRLHGLSLVGRVAVNGWHTLVLRR